MEINKLYQKTFVAGSFSRKDESFSELGNDSIHLIVTSPPYNVGKEYEKDPKSLFAYIYLLRTVFQSAYRVLAPGGRLCICIANTGRKPYLPLHSYIITFMTSLGYLMRGEIIWDKGSSVNRSCAWGTWTSALNPCIRDIHEYILIFSKTGLARERKGVDTITENEFLDYTKSIWTIKSVTSTHSKHPAAFPEELPSRLIKLYSFKDDVVLDPFIGSGTTAVAALKNSRKYIGYDSCHEYLKLARRRIISL